MTATKTISTALEQWASAVTGFNAYEHAPPSLQKALPLVISEVTASRVSISGDPKLPGVGTHQQTALKVWDFELILMVDPEQDSWTATQQLSDAVDALEASVATDPTLGSRVYIASPLVEASYDPPEVEYQDGTVARQSTFTITVGEPKSMEA